MTEFFDKSLHYLGKSEKKINALNIGAMDGIMFDEMIGYTTMYNYRVLYVEPIPYLFEKLKSNIGDKGIFENSAISDYNGEIEMMMIDKDVIDSGLIHSCFYGMSAVYPPKNGLGSEFDRPTVEKYGKVVKVPCITFQTLLDKHSFHNFDIIKVDAEGHDYQIFKQIDLEKYKPKVVRLEWINLSEDEQSKIKESFDKNGYKYEITGQDIVGLEPQFFNELFDVKKEILVNKIYNKTTLVTGLWNIGRDNLNEGWSRSFQQYLNKFEELLKIDCNFIIFGDTELEKFVSERRNTKNTQFVLRDISWFKNNEYYDLIQNIRVNPKWYSQSGWLPDSTQAKLEMYNPLVMSKMFLLNDARIVDKFSSDKLFWIDAGLTNTVHYGYFTHDNVLNKIEEKFNKFNFICFPYDGKVEIHGFEYKKMCEYSGKEVDMVARGGFFGGDKEYISELNSIYYQLLITSLKEGLMGTEESLFTILTYKYSDVINYYEIENNGLLGKFFEDVKNDAIVSKNKEEQQKNIHLGNVNKTSLYVIGFNSPKQFETLIQSMIEYDKSFIEKPKKYLLNNSTDRSTDKDYSEICQKYDFTIINPGSNLGICGGRQYIAEHFENTDSDFMFFFEDDMFFYPKKGDVCKNGFNRYVDNLYSKSLKIIQKENFDFLKLNFTEFFGDNSTQWSWYNVPQVVREKLWPNNTKLPTQGLDPNAPKAKYESVKSFEGIPYVNGEVYYCNWPQIVSKEGNKKMFLDTKWAHPYEQTWMSHMYQETVKGNIKPGLLLMTPTEHNRFDHYSRELRKES